MVANKKQLCELINAVLKAEPALSKEDLIKGSDIESVFKNIMKAVWFRSEKSFNCEGNPELVKIKNQHTTQFKKLCYEDLMLWVMNNLRDMVKSDKKKYSKTNVMLDLQALDVYCVINNNDEHEAFMNDLESRIGGKIRN